MRAAVAGADQQDDRRDGVIEGGRPHLRESALTREAETNVRAFVLAAFPILVALSWPMVDAAERPLFLAAIAWIALAKAAGYVVPWHRFPRWLVLELSQAGEQLPHVETIDLPALVNEVSIGIPDVLVRTSGAPRTIVGHRPSISRLITNLLDNAALHGRDDGEQVTVTIAGRELPGGWQLTVADDGRGFDPDELDALFQPWRRGSDADVSGSGLGLAIVAGIVEQHGGSITASNAEGGGAVLTLTLSRRPSVARAQPSEPPLPAGASS